MMRVRSRGHNTAPGKLQINVKQVSTQGLQLQDQEASMQRTPTPGAGNFNHATFDAKDSNSEIRKLQYQDHATPQCKGANYRIKEITKPNITQVSIQRAPIPKPHVPNPLDRQRSSENSNSLQCKSTCRTSSSMHCRLYGRYNNLSTCTHTQAWHYEKEIVETTCHLDFLQEIGIAGIKR